MKSLLIKAFSISLMLPVALPAAISSSVQAGGAVVRKLAGAAAGVVVFRKAGAAAEVVAEKIAKSALKMAKVLSESMVVKLGKPLLVAIAAGAVATLGGGLAAVGIGTAGLSAIVVADKTVTKIAAVTEKAWKILSSSAIQQYVKNSALAATAVVVGSALGEVSVYDMRKIKLLI